VPASSVYKTLKEKISLTNEPVFNYYPGYAKFLLEKKLKEFAIEQYTFLRATHLPLLKYFEHFSEEQLIELSIKASTELLSHCAANKINEYIEIFVEKWMNNRLPGIIKNQVSAEDISLFSFVRRKLFRHFITSYTSDIHLALKILDEADAFVEKVDATSFQALLNIQYKVYKQTQALACIGTWKWDIKTKKLTWSDELYRIYGLPKDKFEPSYENFLQCLHPDDRDYTNQIIHRAYKDHQPFNYYHRIIRPDGDVRILLAHGEVITNEKGEPIKMTGTGQDVTERKMAEDMLKKTSLELEQKNKELERSNNELASFSYIASHDLQEPLRKIQTFSERILQMENERLSDTGKDHFKRMQSSALRMQILIEDLLSYSRVNTTEKRFEQTDINLLVEEVKNDLSDMIHAKNVIIDASPLPPFKIIPFQFRQLLTNIISNSIKFSKQDCRPYISIEANFVKGDLTNEPEADAEKTYYHLSFQDNGIGFEQKFSKKIFEIFQRLHGRHEYPGTGIGLAICKKIVENHYGFITASGIMNEGSRFDIYLPVLSQEEII